MAGLVLAGVFEKLIGLMIPRPPQAAGTSLNLDLLDVGDSAYLKRLSRHKRGVFSPNCKSSRHK